MIAKLSHEFKSPLQSIIGFSQALLDGVAGELTEKQGKYIRIINKNASEFAVFIDKFLEFSQAESSLISADFQTFDLIAVIQSVIKNYENAFINKNIMVNLDCDELRKRVIFSEENYLKIILSNFIETSIKLTDIGSVNIKVTNPEIEIVKSHGLDVPIGAYDSSYAMISVKDNGMGFAENDFDGLFEPYVQVDKTNKKNFIRSLSLGTANVLLKKINGVMWVESEVMKGTSFNIIIPVEKYESRVYDDFEDFYSEEE